MSQWETMIGENRLLVTDEPVEVQDCRRITDHFRGIYRIFPILLKEHRRMSTCNRLDLQTLGSQPLILAQKSPRSLVENTINCKPMSGKNRRLVADELVEFET